MKDLKHFLQILNERVLPSYFFINNANLYIQWQTNACTQSAIISAYFIDKFLNEKEEKYDVQVWHGDFEEIYKNDITNYNHAWNFIINKQDEESNIVADFTSARKCFHYSKFNHVTLCKDFELSEIKTFSKIRLLQKTQIDWKECLDTHEYYTKKKYSQIITEIAPLLKQLRLWII